MLIVGCPQQCMRMLAPLALLMYGSMCVCVYIFIFMVDVHTYGNKVMCRQYVQCVQYVLCSTRGMYTSVRYVQYEQYVRMYVCIFIPSTWTLVHISSKHGMVGNGFGHLSGQDESSEQMTSELLNGCPFCVYRVVSKVYIFSYPATCHIVGEKHNGLNININKCLDF